MRKRRQVFLLSCCSFWPYLVESAVENIIVDGKTTFAPILRDKKILCVKIFLRRFIQTNMTQSTPFHYCKALSLTHTRTHTLSHSHPYPPTHSRFHPHSYSLHDSLFYLQKIHPLPRNYERFFIQHEPNYSSLVLAWAPCNLQTSHIYEPALLNISIILF